MSEGLQLQRYLFYFSAQHLIHHKCNTTQTRLSRYLFCPLFPCSLRHRFRKSAEFRFRSML